MPAIINPAIKGAGFEVNKLINAKVVTIYQIMLIVAPNLVAI